MITYQCNMARDLVMPMESRRKWLHWFYVYLLVASVTLAVMLFVLVRQTERLLAQRAGLRQQESLMLSFHPGYRNASEYRQALVVMLGVKRRDAASIVNYESREMGMASLLLGLAEVLPPDIRIESFDYDSASRRVVFDVVMPSDRKGHESLSPPGLVALWEQSRRLSGIVSQIEVENSERLKRGGSSVIRWRFAAFAGGR